MSNLSIKGSIMTEEESDENKNPHRLKVVSKYIPILEWFPQYTRWDAVADIIAGVTLGLTIIPQSIAYTTVAGLSAQYGLYSAFIGSLIYVVFGKIKEVSIGPTALMALLTMDFTRNMPVEFVILLTFLAGCMELLMGLLNLGFLVDFISMPATSGFTSATSVIIAITQLQGLFGLKYKTFSNVDSIIKFFQHINDIRIGDTIVGLSSIAFLLLLRWIKNMNPCCVSSDKSNRVIKKALWFLSIGRNALLISITSIIASMLHKAGKSPFILLGKVESGLPSFDVPSFSAQVGNETYTFIDMCSHFGSGIIVVPLIAVLANVAIAKAFAAGKPVDASQEMLTLGLCNIFGSFVQSMPTCGAFTRSAVSNASGVRTPLAGLYSGTMTLLAMSFLTPYFYYIPRASLSAVLISAVVFMIDWSIITLLWKGSKKDMTAALGTFVACLAFDVELGLLFGVTLNMLFLLHAWARPSIHITKCKTADGEKYILISPDIGLFYPMIGYLRTKINEVATNEGRNVLPIVLDCDSFKGIDYTAVQGIDAITQDFEKKGQDLLFLRFNPNILKKIELLGGITKLRHAVVEEDIAGILFGHGVEMSRSETLPIMKCVDEMIDEHVNTEEDCTQMETLSDCKIEPEKETLLSAYEAVITELATVEKSQLKNKDPEL
ncbi:sodium-independent sulfate anion transporter-like [Athalia rosae]|uniref:sodium-independent sulfate anion transporter-like n=1 Tax=Athalia rosae TaxID=37344 RepID=UPI0020336F47|nr:sodium-independent sulfate anion transporter-like [Athalia rosae]